MPILVCPHCAGRVGCTKPRPEHCPSCEKQVAFSAWRVAPPAIDKDYRITAEDFLFLKTIDVLPD